MRDEFSLEQKLEAMLCVAIEPISVEELADIVDTKRSLRLEMIVIFLIAFEVVLAFYEIYARQGH